MNASPIFPSNLLASDLILEHYLQFDEATRLTGPFGEFEFARIRELITRHLPIRPGEIADVGGGTGAYSIAPIDFVRCRSHRVLREDGVLLAVAINRYAGVIYGLTQRLV